MLAAAARIMREQFAAAWGGSSMATVRSLLDTLKLADRAAIDRLCGIRGVEPRVIAKCERLARSYRRDYEQLFQDLREQDLRVLLVRPHRVDGELCYLAPTATYTKAKLTRIALACLRDDEIPPELVRLASFTGSKGAAKDEEAEAEAEAEAESDDGPESVAEFEDESDDGTEADDDEGEEESDSDEESPVLDNAFEFCLLYTSPSPRDRTRSRMPSSA